MKNGDIRKGFRVFHKQLGEWASDHRGPWTKEKKDIATFDHHEDAFQRAVALGESHFAKGIIVIRRVTIRCVGGTKEKLRLTEQALRLSMFEADTLRVALTSALTSLGIPTARHAQFISSKNQEANLPGGHRCEG